MKQYKEWILNEQSCRLTSFSHKKSHAHILCHYDKPITDGLSNVELWEEILNEQWGLNCIVSVYESNVQDRHEAAKQHWLRYFSSTRFKVVDLDPDKSQNWIGNAKIEED